MTEWLDCRLFALNRCPRRKTQQRPESSASAGTVAVTDEYSQRRRRRCLHKLGNWMDSGAVREEIETTQGGPCHITEHVD